MDRKIPTTGCPTSDPRPSSSQLAKSGAPCLRSLLAYLNNPRVPMADKTGLVHEAIKEADQIEADAEKNANEARAQFAGAARLGAALDALDEDDAETLDEARAVLAEYGHNADKDDGADELREALEETIREDALSVEVGEHGKGTATIVLCTGGPHAEFVVGLDRFNEADEVEEVIFKNWGTRIENPLGVDRAGLLAYARALYLGE